MPKGKGLIRSTSRRGVASGKAVETEMRGSGRVLLQGAFVAAHEEEIRRRLNHVVERARFAQPARRILSIARDANGLEVRTTSQELAHRIAHEMKKAFHGQASYTWSDGDGSLLAVWQRGV